MAAGGPGGTKMMTRTQERILVTSILPRYCSGRSRSHLSSQMKLSLPLSSFKFFKKCVLWLLVAGFGRERMSPKCVNKLLPDVSKQSCSYSHYAMGCNYCRQIMEAAPRMEIQNNGFKLIIQMMRACLERRGSAWHLHCLPWSPGQLPAVDQQPWRGALQALSPRLPQVTNQCVASGK